MSAHLPPDPVAKALESGVSTRAARRRREKSRGSRFVKTNRDEECRLLTVQEIDDLGWAVQRFREHTNQTLHLRDLRRLDRLVALQEALERDGLIRVTA